MLASENRSYARLQFGAVEMVFEAGAYYKPVLRCRAVQLGQPAVTPDPALLDLRQWALFRGVLEWLITSEVNRRG